MSASTTQYAPTPFDNYLQTGEKLLWTSAVKQPNPLATGAKYGVILVGALVGAMIGAFYSELSQLDFGVVGPLIFAGLVAFGVVVFIFVAIGQFVRNKLTKKSMYGITNQRLLTYTNGFFNACGLTEVPSIMKFEGKDGRGSLNFGTTFPMFNDVANVNRVHALITDQQKKLQQRAQR